MITCFSTTSAAGSHHPAIVVAIAGFVLLLIAVNGLAPGASYG